MLFKIASASLIGIDAYLVDVEVDISFGIPGFVTVGLPDASVRESKERVRAALKNCGYKFPSRKIIINLAPADRRKEGSAFGFHSGFWPILTFFLMKTWATICF